MSTKTLRQYQIEDDAAIEAALKEYQSVIYQLPTGGGKSVVATNVIGRRRNKNVLVFAHKRRLITQLEDHFKSLGGRVGVLGGGREDNLDANIVIVSIRTAAKDNRLEALLERSWDFVFIDEARNSRTKTYDKVIAALKEHNPVVQLFGVDATPWRKDRKRLDFHFDHMVVSKETTGSLMEKGWLQKVKTIVCPFDIKSLKDEVHEVANDYQISELSKFMRKRQYLEFIVEKYINEGEDRNALVFAVDKAHAQSIVEIFEEFGYKGKVAKVDSSMSQSEVDATFAAFESGEIQILVNVEMVTEGVDMSIIGCIIGARPTKSLTLYLQMGGRGPRPDGLHDYCILLDCCGWTQEWGTLTAPRQWSLNPEIDPNDARIGYKVLGKKEDGTFEENIEDFDGEIVELSPEEYFEQLMNGQEQAEVHNKSIEQKIDDVCEQIISMLFGGVDKKGWKDRYRITDTSNYRGEFNIRLSALDKRKSRELNEDGTFKTYRYKYFGVEVHNVDIKERKPYVRVTEGDMFDCDLLQESYEWQVDRGMMYQTLATSAKASTDIFGLVRTIKQYEQKKIDLEVFKQRKKELEEKQFLEELTNFAKEKDHLFTGEGRADVDHHFKDNGSWNGLFYRPIVGIHIKGGLKGHHNNLILHIKDHLGEIKMFEKSYVKGEKVVELIKLLKWKKQE